MADEAPLTVEQATELLRGPEPAPETAATEPEAEEIASPTEADSPSEPEEAGDEAEASEEPAAEVVDPPTWWDAEQKAAWALLTPEAQAAVRVAEDKREAVTAKAKAEAATAIRQASEEAAQAKGVLDSLGKVVPQWVETFKSRWANVDWEAWASQDLQAYTIGKMQYEKEQSELAQALQTQEVAKQTQLQAFYKERTAQLPDYAPELADPEKGEERQLALSKHLVGLGGTAERIRAMDALEMSIAWKAYKYDQVQASIAAKPKPAPQRGNVAPTAPPTRTSQVRSLEQVNARLDKNHDIDSGVAVLRALREARRK